MQESYGTRRLAEWALAGWKTRITVRGVRKGFNYIRIFGIGNRWNRGFLWDAQAVWWETIMHGFSGGKKISLAYSSDIFPTLRATCKGLHLIDLLSSLNFDKSCCSVNSTLGERAYTVWGVYSKTGLVRSLSIMFLISVRETKERVWNWWQK